MYDRLGDDMKLLNEKYRPQTFDDVIGLDKTVPELVKSNMPHFIFYGPPGTGKSTTMKIILKTLGCNYLELNGSDERGIDMIREKVKVFASTKSDNNKIKVVVIEEADGLTIISQEALRSIIEKYENNCRFILLCNYENKLIDAIKQSRCTRVGFKYPSIEQLTKRLCFICCKENIKYKEETCKRLAELSNRDYRAAVNLLQQSSTNGELMVNGVKITKHSVEILNLLKQKKYIAARQYVINNIVDYDGFILELLDEVLNGNYNIKTKEITIDEVAEMQFRFKFVAEKEIQVGKALKNIMIGGLNNA